MKNRNIFYILFCLGIVSCIFCLTNFGQNFLLFFAEKILLKRELARPEKWIFIIKKFSLFFLILFLLVPFSFWFCVEKENESSGFSIFLKSNVIYFFVSAIIILILCSTTSPLYAFHTWDDSNCFFTVGKSLLHGKVLYKDIYEQKGPFLYFIHTVAFLISQNSFLGVWFFEIAAATLFLYFSFKTVSLFVSCEMQQNLKLFLPLILAIIFSSNSFVVGDSAEEFCMSLLAYPLFVSVKNLKTECEFSRKELFLSGMCAGLVFFIKFSLVGFFIGWAVVPIFYYAKNKNLSGILFSVIYIFSGVFVISLPVLIYFFANDAVSDLLQVYFLDNVLLYRKSGNGNAILQAMLFCKNGFVSAYKSNLLVFAMLIASAVTVLKMKCAVMLKAHIFACYVFSMFFIFCGGRAYAYYSLILSVFCVFAILLFPLNKKLKKRRAFCRCVFLILIICATSQNVTLLRLKKSDYPQFQFAKIINQKENATLLNYGFLDGGFYTVAKIVPNCKYFCGLNIPNPKISEEQNKFVENALVDFVVTRNKKLESENYELVQSFDCKIRKSEGKFFLYTKK